jgi:DNA-binding MarR family transcriptional regulator
LRILKGIAMGYVEESVTALTDAMSERKRNILNRIEEEKRGEIFILKHLAFRGTTSPSELGKAMCSTKGRISAALGTLENKGQIIRETDKNDRRGVLVTITGAGRERVERERRETQEYLGSIFRKMGKADTQEFIRLTRKFSEIEKSLLEK